MISTDIFIKMSASHIKQWGDIKEKENEYENKNAQILNIKSHQDKVHSLQDTFFRTIK